MALKFSCNLCGPKGMTKADATHHAKKNHGVSLEEAMTQGIIVLEEPPSCAEEAEQKKKSKRDEEGGDDQGISGAAAASSR